MLLFSFSLSLLEFQLLPYSTPHSKWRYSIQFGRMTLKLIERRNVAERMEQMTSQNGPNLDIYIYIYIYFYIGSFFIYLRVYLYLSIYLCAFWFLPCKMTLIDLNKQDNRTVDGIWTELLLLLIRLSLLSIYSFNCFIYFQFAGIIFPPPPREASSIWFN